MRKKKLISYLLYLFLGVGLLYYLFQENQYSTSQLKADFNRCNFLWLGASACTLILSNWVRALKWNLFLSTINQKSSVINNFLFISVGYFINSLVPRAGEIARSTYHSKYQQVLFEKSLATVILDRLTDFIGLSFVLLLTVLLQFNIFYNYLTQTIKFDIKFISIILLACVALAWVVRKIFSQSIIRENERIRNFYSALKSIKRVNDFKLLIIYTAIIWILYYLMHQFCIYSFPETMELPPVVGLTILSFGAFGILLPSPGGIGSYHYFIIIALSFYGLEEKDGLSFSNINFLLLYLTNILMGVIAFISIPIYNRQIHS